MKFVSLILMFVATACVATVEPASDEETPSAESSEALKIGAGGPGLGLGFADTGPYSDCLIACSQAKAACESRNTRRLLADGDDLMEPCDLFYSMCKDRCDRTFPE